MKDLREKEASKDKEIRQSNLELLRIVMMVAIVAHHFAVHSGFSFPSDIPSANQLWIQFIRMGGKIGVNVYVLISGYFLVKSDSFSFTKVLKLWLQILFYSVLIYSVFVILRREPFSLRELAKCFFPVTVKKYWFASTYFVLYLMTPFLNKLLRALTKTEYQKMILGGVIIWSVIPTLLNRSFQSNDLIWFVVLYVIAGYIRLHMDYNRINGRLCKILSVVFVGLTYLTVIAFELLEIKYDAFSKYTTYYYDMNKLTILVISVLVFLSFLTMSVKNNKVINTIASTCFGVYLIHDNALVRKFLWKDLFVSKAYVEWNLLIPYSVFAILMVFMLSALLELLRIWLIERKYSKGIKKVAIRGENLANMLLNHIRKKN